MARTTTSTAKMNALLALGLLVAPGAFAAVAANAPRQVFSSTSDASTTTAFTIGSSTLATTTLSSVETPTTTVALSVSTSVPSPTAALNSTLPSQAPLAPIQAWCPSDIFCNGNLLQTINLAQLYGDSKTFVDKPTVFSSNQTLSDFYSLYNNSGANYSEVTYGALETYVDNDFKGEGLELQATTLPSNSTPSFLQPNTTSITSSLILGWTQIVHSYWSSLVRNTDPSALCDGLSCESTLIPLNHTFVVPGGRFREQYYWDSFWIVEGLIKSEYYDLVNATLQNFMDELEKFGFIPNGGRIYYLNRSQPPLFMKMVWAYVNATSDLSILDRALPLAETELTWWATNRTANITSPYSGNTVEVARYAVNNTAPRPEGFLEDYETANDPTLETPLSEDDKEALYAELASGAESGHDYTARFSSAPLTPSNATNQNNLLRTLKVREIVPVDLNSILYGYRSQLAQLYQLAAGNLSSVSPPGNSTNATSFLNGNASYYLSRAEYHTSYASTLRSTILDLFWDSNKLAFYDFNTTSNARSDWHSPATFYPYWNGIVPDEVLGSETSAMGAFASVRMAMSRWNGTYPASWVVTGLQWDAPNAWPPHQYIILQALAALPPNISSSPLPTLSSNTSSYSLIPAGQLGFNETDLPPQPLADGGFANTTGYGADINDVAGNGTVVNGGDPQVGEGWAGALEREVVNRYMGSVFCSWYATGGSIPGLLPQLPADELNVTFSLNNTGNMFEKESMFDIDVSGSGGEYTVQAGFGWTNGIVLWAAETYGSLLSTPNCPPINTTSTSTAISFAALNGRKRDMERMEREGKYRKALARRKLARRSGGSSGAAAMAAADVRAVRKTGEKERSAVSRQTLERIKKGMPAWMFAKTGRN